VIVICESFCVVFIFCNHFRILLI